MTSSEFHIILQIKTPEGFEPFGKFSIGDHRTQAEAIFKMLKGDPQCSDDDMLQMDLIEEGDGLPRKLQVVRCSLEDVAENCRIITREWFKYRSIEP